MADLINPPQRCAAELFPGSHSCWTTLPASGALALTAAEPHSDRRRHGWVRGRHTIAGRPVSPPSWTEISKLDATLLYRVNSRSVQWRLLSAFYTKEGLQHQHRETTCSTLILSECFTTMYPSCHAIHRRYALHAAVLMQYRPHAHPGHPAPSTVCPHPGLPLTCSLPAWLASASLLCLSCLSSSSACFLS